MQNRIKKVFPIGLPVILITLLIVAAWPAEAQDRLKTMPGYDQYKKMANAAKGSVDYGSLDVVWRDGGKSFEYNTSGKSYRLDIATGKAEEIGMAVKGDKGQKN